MPMLTELYRRMAVIRALDQEAIALQRQGAILGFAPCTGQEAAQVGSAAALDPSIDFAFPTYREFAAMIALGVDPVDLFAHHRGYSDGGAHDPLATHVMPLNSVVGGTALHAVGWAMGAKLDRLAACAIAYFGDGASSQGEVHEAMNFAGVYRLPVIFFCQNNGWAISVPSVSQISGGSVAMRAAGYGMPGVTVDGNDVLAVRAATAEAAERARGGGGPTVIEAMTHRLGPHATSDDPSRYRDQIEQAAERQRDPLVLARASLIARGEAGDAFFAEVARDAEHEIERVRAGIDALRPRTMDEQLELVYARPPASWRAQVDTWLGGMINV
jgi:pyruvate dehydrogenase E1 component alpha subunit